MSRPSQPFETRAAGSTIRLSRVIRLPWAVTLGCSVTIGLGVYSLLGEYVRITGRHAAPPYLILLIFAIPFVLTFWERVVSLPGDGGGYQISRSSGILWHRYFSGWLLLGGYITLIGLLSWGIGFYLEASLALLGTPFPFDRRWLAVAGLALMVLYNMASRRANWRQRLDFTLIAIGFLVVVSSLGVLAPGNVRLVANYLTPQATMLSVVTLMMSGLWGLHLVLDVRAQLQQPTRTVRWALAGPVVAMSTVGAIAALAISRHQGALAFPALPLIDVLLSLDFLPQGIMLLLFLLLGFGLNLLAGDRGLKAAAQLLDGMARDGFLPAWMQRPSSVDRPATSAIALFISITLALMLLMPIETLIGLAAITFLWSAALIHLPDLFRREPSLPPKRPLRLPFHPLFPGLTVATGLLLPATLPLPLLISTALWLAGGALCYTAYARRQGLASRRERVVVDEDEQTLSPDGALETSTFTVIAAIANPRTSAAIVHLACKLAKANDGQVLALKIVDLPEYSNQIAWQRVAHREWAALSEQFEAGAYGGVSVRPIVRLASSVSEGILQTVREEEADWLLAGWSGATPSSDDEAWVGGDRASENGAAGGMLADLVSYADCNVGVLRKALSAELVQIVVATSGGPHAVAGLMLARAAVVEDGGRVHLVNVVRGISDPDLSQKAEQVLACTLDAASAQKAGNVYTSVINAPTVAGGVANRYKEADLLIVGASKTDMPERSFFGGLARELIEQDDRPALLVRKLTPVRFPLLRRNRDRLAGMLPSLTPARRGDVRRQMRSSALPTMDFFVLIVLSSIIATLGLLQNSAAVIIGAMLVAPLMSPILAIGMGMAVGEATTVRNGVESTLKGISMAIVVGAVVVLFSPLNTPTHEILARASPNLLDLMVALASGAAAGYAISRKEVAAALPGVAIAAALVPPLCVVGYGIGVSQLDIAAGASLLFVTNLIAIVFAAAVTFLALGFHPPRVERGQLIRSLRTTIISLAIIAVILLGATASTVRQEQIRRNVDVTFAAMIDERSARVVELSVAPSRGSHTITATVIAYAESDFTPEKLNEMEAELEAAVGTPVEVDVTVLQGWRDDLTNIDQRLLVVDMLSQTISNYGASVEQASAQFAPARGYMLDATILVYDGHTLTEEVLQEIQVQMMAAVDAPVELDATFLHAVRAELPAPTATPAS